MLDLGAGGGRRALAVGEVRLLASLAPHPHVVHCLEGFLDSGSRLCAVMELASGGELAGIIR